MIKPDEFWGGIEKTGLQVGQTYIQGSVCVAPIDQIGQWCI